LFAAPARVETAGVHCSASFLVVAEMLSRPAAAGYPPQRRAPRLQYQ
jgi:hypothetical protein